MKIKSAIVCNYRIHRERRVEFDDKLTLLAGPNESGKSTLVEAMHRALFLRARVAGSVSEEMASAHGGTPNVELSLDFGGTEAHLTKTFKGARGTTTLSLAGQPALSGDAAEDRLAELLHAGTALEGRGAANQLPRKWAHLWVWQGSAGTSPFESVGEQQDTLVQRLQRMGGSAVTQSDLDARVVREIQTRYSGAFTERGVPRAGSDLAGAEESLGSLQASLQERQQAMQALEDAATRYTRALAEIVEKTRAQDASRQELDGAGEKLRRADEISHQLEPVRRQQEEAVAGIAALDRIAKDLAAARQQQKNAGASLAPREEALENLQRDLDSCREDMQQADAAWEIARAGAASARLWKSALEAHLQTLERKKNLDALKKDREKIVCKRKELQDVRDQVARAPQVGQRDLSSLQKLQQDVAAAEAALAALGARIEVVASREPVRVGGHKVVVGSNTAVTSDTEVCIGTVATLRIAPGGSTGIADARRAVDAARQKLIARLSTLGVDSPESAIVACEELRGLQTRIEALEADLERLDADSNEEAVRECEQAVATASRRAELAVVECQRTLPTSPAEAQKALSTGEEENRQAEAGEKGTRAACKAIRTKFDELTSGVVEATAAADAIRRQWQDLTVRIGTLEEQHGTDADRADRQLKLQTGQEQATAMVENLQQQLDELQPEQLRSDGARLNGAIRQLQAGIDAATQDRAEARALLTRSGTTDPQQDLENARVLHERACMRRDELRARAEAIRRLAVLAEEMQRQVEQQINKPLEDAARGYFECVFGTGSRLELRGGLQAGGRPELNVIREQAGLGNFRFDQLSGGAKEQVGIAMRLAMAEVLAADHGGSLPIVLDDAFANSDPERVRLLQRMLYRASQRGLQIIVLTCNPSDYGALGAREIRLERQPIRCAAPPQSTPQEIGEGGLPAEEPAGAAVDADRDAFLAKLSELGGRSGNQSLRESLGWSPERYESVKDALVSACRVVPGQGRGGSVRVAGPGG